MGGAWDLVELARHPERPAPPFYVGRLIDGFLELRGDRVLYDDPACWRASGASGRNAWRSSRSGVGHPSSGRGPAQGDAHPGPGRALRSAGAQLRRHRRRPPHGVAAWPSMDGGRPASRALHDAPGAHRLHHPVCRGCLGRGAGAVHRQSRHRATERLPRRHRRRGGERHPAAHQGDRAPEAAELLRASAADMVRLGLCTRVVPEGKGAHRNPEGVTAALREALSSSWP